MAHRCRNRGGLKTRSRIDAEGPTQSLQHLVQHLVPARRRILFENKQPVQIETTLHNTSRLPPLHVALALCTSIDAKFNLEIPPPLTPLDLPPSPPWLSAILRRREIRATTISTFASTRSSRVTSAKITTRTKANMTRSSRRREVRVNRRA